ncbi:hypothetical protein Tco_0577867 [Tanacetum coccineum]
MLNESERLARMEVRNLWVEKENEYTSMLRLKARRIEKILLEEAALLEMEFNEAEVWDAIRAAEGLNAIVLRRSIKGIFRGVRIGRNRVVVSHLQYANDTIFFGEWSKENVRSLMCILKYFKEVSGLRINYNKSKLYGAGVNDREISKMARWMRCGVGEFLFTYLDLLIGENMRRVGAWNPVIDKFKKTLGRHLEEIHVTWALFWKKRDKSATLHNEGLKNCLQKVETASGLLATPSG